MSVFFGPDSLTFGVEFVFVELVFEADWQAVNPANRTAAKATVIFLWGIILPLNRSDFDPSPEGVGMR
jgi:hypothetical protein